jgi:prephenate dehydrogenase
MTPRIAPFRRAAILGLGLIGGSIGLALRQEALAGSVAGADPDAAAREGAVKAGAVDEAFEAPASAVRGADLVVLAAPVGSLPALLEAVQPALDDDAIVTDVGSVKTGIVALGEARMGARFVGGHPMAGSERSGIAAARAHIFRDSAWAIVRAQPFGLESDPPAARIAALVSALGARPLLLTSDQHDRLAALVSHLPHALSFAFAALIDSDPEQGLAKALAGGSFRDLIRVSKSDARLWQDIFLANRDHLREAIAGLRLRLEEIERSLEADHP